MSNNQLSSRHNENRLYTRLVTILKTLQVLGFFIVAILFIIMFSIFGQASLSFGGANIFLLLPLVDLIIPCIIIYILTAALIAVIDLLSRIEKNTRTE